MRAREDTRRWANADAKPLEQLSAGTRNFGAPPRREQQTDPSKRPLQERPRRPDLVNYPRDPLL